MMQKIKININELKELYQISVERSTSHLWPRLALEWCEEAAKEIERLRSLCREAGEYIDEHSYIGEDSVLHKELKEAGKITNRQRS